MITSSFLEQEKRKILIINNKNNFFIKNKLINKKFLLRIVRKTKFLSFLKKQESIKIDKILFLKNE
jgi:hypothetical protein